MGLPYCQPGVGEIKPQIIIFLWFSFSHIERESARRAIDCFVKHPLDSGGVCLPYRIWPIKPPGCCGFLPLDVPHLPGFAARGDRRVDSSGTESRVAMGEPRQALKHKTERNKSNHRILRGDADGWRLSLITSASRSFTRADYFISLVVQRLVMLSWKTSPWKCWTPARQKKGRMQTCSFPMAWKWLPLWLRAATGMLLIFSPLARRL